MRTTRGFRRVRHYGLLANRGGADHHARCRALLAPDATEHGLPTADEPLAARILRLTGIDILRCPVCGQGPMRRLDHLLPDTS